MRHETQTVAGHDRRVKTGGVQSLIAPPPLSGFGPGVVELPLLLSGETAAALEAAAAERGLTVAQLVRLLLRDFLARMSDDRVAAAVIRTKYGRQAFETKEEFIAFQRDCTHPSATWVHGGCDESFVCERCWAVLEVGWPDDHPAIDRWLNEGGSGRPSEM